MIASQDEKLKQALQKCLNITDAWFDESDGFNAKL